MRITVKYGSGGRWFGNGYDMPDYQVSVKSSRPRYGDPSIDLHFTFDHFVGGRGVGDNQGSVSGATLSMSAAHARQLAVNILWALEQTEENSLSIAFGKAIKEAQ